MTELLCRTAKEWRAWLARHHDAESEVWLVFLKSAGADQELDYESAVREGLCYGWIDSIIKRLDDTRHARKFTPRQPTSNWSATNIRRVEELIAAGRMAKPGLAVVEEAKKAGRFAAQERPPLPTHVHPEFARALDAAPKARAHFEALAPTHRKPFLLWINTARRDETRQRRIAEAIELLKKGEKLGLR